ncbi:MAG: SusC/RagA family TonB-linked outer membrane protein [Paludibacter sp.]
MKNYLNIFDKMNRDIFCFKIIVLILIISLSPTTAVNSENSLSGKDKVVIGMVRDAHTKLPINAAQITVSEKNESVVSDEKGKFTLKISSPKEVLTISAYDYNSSEVAVRGKDTVIIELYSNQFSNYFKSIESLTGTVNNSTLASSVKSVDNLNRSTAIAADDVLQTALGGDVRAISRSGVAGMGSTLFIRGINSINANAQPLFVVDGVIWNNLYDVESIHQGFFSNPLDNIDMSDIEDITVVKDGTSIYGSKGSNGVILIKTKRAKSMVTKIGLNIFSGITTRPGSLPMMNGEDFRIYANDLLKSKGFTGNDISGFGFLETDPSNIKVYNTNHNNTDWSNEVYQSGMTNNYLINANGGDEKALYYFSLGYTDNKGVVKTTNMQRINSRFNADFNLVENLKMGLNIGFSRVERMLLDDGVNSYSSPTWMSRIKSPFLSPYSYTYAGGLTTDYAFTDELSIGNPAGLIYSSINNLKEFRFNIGILPSMKITPDLTLSSQLDYSVLKTIEGRFVPMHFTPVRFIEGYGNSENEINSQVMRNTAIFDDTRLTYEKKFNTYNHLKALLGWRYISNYYESDYVEEHNSGSNNNTTITGGYKYLQVNGINNLTNSLSNYLNVDYDYNKRYFVSGAVSVDNSSRFGNKTVGGFSLFGRSWGVFPSVDAGWIVSSEKFMKNLDFVNLFKIRAGFGLTGNDGIKDYESMAYFSSIRFMDKANGLILSNLKNSTVQWETTSRAHAGADLSLFKERLFLSFDYFSSVTSNLLVLKNLPEYTGLGQYWNNSGTMNNKGFELSANVKALNFTKLKWELGFSVGHYLNKITSLPEGNYTTSVYDGEVYTAVGQSVGVFYGYKTKGVFASDALASTAYTNPTTGAKDYLKIQNPDGSFTKFGAGDMIFDDKNGDGVIDEKDKQVIGNPNPDLYGTITSKISYNRISLSTVFTYSYGNDIYNYQRSQLEAGKDFSNQTSAMLRRWTADGQLTDQPKAVFNDPMGNSRFSDRWIEDGSYIKLKNITLSYELPIKSDFIEGFNIWVSANNLLTLTKYLGTDPEFSAGNSVYYQGIDNGLIPQTKSYYIGIKFSL